MTVSSWINQMPGMALTYQMCLVVLLQNRFITFDESMMPGPGFQNEGLFFDQHAHHNIPGYLDNVKVGPFQSLTYVYQANASYLSYEPLRVAPPGVCC